MNVGAAGGVRIVRATSPEERRAALAARHAVFRGLENLSGVAPGDPLDEWDRRENTDHFMAYRPGEPFDTGVVGLGRILYGPGRQSETILNATEVTPPEPWCEPSRNGLAEKLRGTPAGKEIMGRIIGLQVLRSLELGCKYWGVTMRTAMALYTHKFPWVYAKEPVLYPASRGGPKVDEPIFVARLHLPSLGVLLVSGPEFYEVMFPDGNGPHPEHIEGGVEAAASRARQNHKDVRQYLRDWRLDKVQPLDVTG